MLAAMVAGETDEAHSLLGFWGQVKVTASKTLGKLAQDVNCCAAMREEGRICARTARWELGESDGGETV